jgi:Flp pilus assembly protein TadG
VTLCRLWPRRSLIRVISANGDDRGSSAIELVFLAPALLILTMLLVQWVLWFEARGVALASAQAGAQVAREQATGWESQSVTRATGFYNAVGPKLLSGVAVRVNPDGGQPNQVFVTVSGQVPTLLPSWLVAPLTVSETSGGDVECFRTFASGGQQCSH